MPDAPDTEGKPASESLRPSTETDPEEESEVATPEETVGLLLEVAQQKLQAQLDTISQLDTKVGVLMAFDAVVLTAALPLGVPFWPKATYVLCFLFSAGFSTAYLWRLDARNNPDPYRFYEDSLGKNLEEAKGDLLLHTLEAHKENKEILDGKARNIIRSTVCAFAGLLIVLGSYLWVDWYSAKGGDQNGRKASATTATAVTPKAATAPTVCQPAKGSVCQPQVQEP